MFISWSLSLAFINLSIVKKSIFAFSIKGRESFLSSKKSEENTDKIIKNSMKVIIFFLFCNKNEGKNSGRKLADNAKKKEDSKDL
jgi:hypothetical protein